MSELTTESVRIGHVTGPESAARFERWLASVKAEAKLEAYGEITRLAADVNALCAIMRAQDRVLELVPSVVNARQERESESTDG